MLDVIGCSRAPHHMRRGTSVGAASCKPTVGAVLIPVVTTVLVLKELGLWIRQD